MFPQHLAPVEDTLDTATMIRSISFDNVTLRGMDTWQRLKFHSILHRLKLSFVKVHLSLQGHHGITNWTSVSATGAWWKRLLKSKDFPWWFGLCRSSPPGLNPTRPSAPLYIWKDSQLSHAACKTTSTLSLIQCSFACLSSPLFELQNLWILHHEATGTHANMKRVIRPYGKG